MGDDGPGDVLGDVEGAFDEVPEGRVVGEDVELGRSGGGRP